MKGLRRFLIWGLIFCALLAGMDQLLLKVSLNAPGLHEVQVFYRDFRSRLLAMVGGPAGESIDQLIDAAEQSSTPGRTLPAASSRGPLARPAGAKHRAGSGSDMQRYLYVDQEGALQFADSWQQVPKRFRASAQPLKD